MAAGYIVGGLSVAPLATVPALLISQVGQLAVQPVMWSRHNQVTQIFVAQSQTRLGERLRGRNFAENIVRLAEDIQVTVVADRSRRLGS
jgi:K+-sensing histidine kinase KdpD